MYRSTRKDLNLNASGITGIPKSKWKVGADPTSGHPAESGQVRGYGAGLEAVLNKHVIVLDPVSCTFVIFFVNIDIFIEQI